MSDDRQPESPPAWVEGALPEDTYLSIAVGIGLPEPEGFTSNSLFRAVVRGGHAAGRTAAAAAIENHAESIGWYEADGVWAEAIEIARGQVHPDA